MHQQQINRVNEILTELNLLLPVLKSTHVVSGSLQKDGKSIVGLELSMTAIPTPDESKSARAKK